MATPLKPWERNGSGSSIPVSSNTPGNGDNRNRTSPMRPAIPPRPNSINSGYTPYGTTANYYNPNYPGPSYGYNMYSGYGYRPYSIYGTGSGGYGLGGVPLNSEESALMRQAEERTRATFQSVESVVGAFGSIAMMLESTYFAVHSCFRALLGVAQHFSRMKNHFWGILSAISILRRLQIWLRKLLALLHLTEYSQTDEVWNDISCTTPADSFQAQPSTHRFWPVVTFFTIIVGVPWLLWRLLSSAVSESTDVSMESWSQNTGNVARALYDFTAERQNELTISAGDELIVAPLQLQPHATGWVLVGRNRRSGFVPSNYIELLPTSGRTSQNTASSIPSAPPNLNLSDD